MDDLTRDFYEERRRKWRRSAFWRGVLVSLSALLLIGVLGIILGGGPRFGDHIARVDLEGVIYDDPVLDATLKEVEENDNAKALILTISSPGGSTVGSEALFERLREISKKKPVVSVLGEVAASGGYIAAIGADYIIARGNTITGSIGVIMEYPDVTAMLTKLGITMQTVRSSDIKGGPSPFRRSTSEARAAQKVLIDESHDWFRGLVEDRRGLTGLKLDEVADGRVFTGRLALALGLVDAIGGFDDATEYLDSLDSIDTKLPVDTYALEYEKGGFLGSIGEFLLRNGGLERISGQSGPRLYSIAK